eukprot:820616-Prymnesium_polylepis.1
MAFEGLWGAAAGKRSEGCSRELSEAEAKIARPMGRDRRSPHRSWPCDAIFNSVLADARLGCSPSAFTSGGAAEP